MLFACAAAGTINWINFAGQTKLFSLPLVADERWICPRWGRSRSPVPSSVSGRAAAPPLFGGVPGGFGSEVAFRRSRSHALVKGGGASELGMWLFQFLPGSQFNSTRWALRLFYLFYSVYISTSLLACKFKCEPILQTQPLPILAFFFFFFYRKMFSRVFWFWVSFLDGLAENIMFVLHFQKVGSVKDC